MQLDYKDIIIKHYALSMSGSEIARQAGFSKSGVNDFLRAFKKCEDLSYPLPAGITNYGIALKVYGAVPVSYTHLDVYKRQILITLAVSSDFRLNIKIEFSSSGLPMHMSICWEDLMHNSRFFGRFMRSPFSTLHSSVW